MHLLAPSPATTVATPQRAPGLRYVLAVLAAAACSASTTPAAGAAPHLNLNQLERVEIADGYGNRSEVTITRITYRAFDGRLRDAYVILPAATAPATIRRSRS